MVVGEVPVDVAEDYMMLARQAAASRPRRPIMIETAYDTPPAKSLKLRLLAVAG